MGKLIVAVADDDAPFRASVAETLREHDIDVIEASDGATLLGILNRSAVAAVVTDLAMPRLRGEDVINLMRLSGDLTPFVVLTGIPDVLNRDVTRWPKVTVLKKPVTEAALVQAVESSITAA